MKPMHVPTGFPVSGQTLRGGTPGRMGPSPKARHEDYRKFLACLNAVGQTEIAKILSITEAQVYSFASGSGKPTMVMIAKLKLDPRLKHVFDVNMKESKPGSMAQAAMPSGIFATSPPAAPTVNGVPAVGVPMQVKSIPPASSPVTNVPKEPPPPMNPPPAATVTKNGKPKPFKKGKKFPRPPKPSAVVPEKTLQDLGQPGSASQAPASPPADEGEQQITPWQGRSLCVIEAFYQAVHPGCHLAMKDWYDPTTMRTAQKSQEAFLERSRNRLASMFLKTGCEWSLWIDSDIITPCRPEIYRALVNKETSERVPDSLLRVPLPTRLVNWGKTIVSGVYFDRHGKGSIMAKLRGRPAGKLPQNCLHACDWVATGCVLVHRQVFLDVAAKYPDTAPSENGESAFFTPWRREDGFVTGEDEAFFTRAANAGHPSYIDLGVICGHVGFFTYGLESGTY